MSRNLKRAYYRPSHLFERYMRVRRTQDFVGQMSALFSFAVIIALLVLAPHLWWFFSAIAIGVFAAGMWWVAKEETAQIKLATRIWEEGEPEEMVQLFCVLAASNYRNSDLLTAGARSFTENLGPEFPVLSPKDYSRILMASAFSAFRWQRIPILRDFCIAVIRSAPQQVVDFKARKALQSLVSMRRKRYLSEAISKAAQVALAEVSERANRLKNC